MATVLSLSEQQNQWVQSTLDALSIEECAGQLLCPMIRPNALDEVLTLLDQVPLGSLFFLNIAQEDLRNLLHKINQNTNVPLLIAGDLERGASALRTNSTPFPWSMAAGAANDENLMVIRGQATAIEGRCAGFNWNFSPVVDLNLNFNNPITSIRALSDDPERVIRLTVPLIQAMQDNGMLATAKHFPGDGVDDRDQHLVTTFNTLPMEQWWELYGAVWKAVIAAGVRSIMPGHIGLPDYQGYQDDPQSVLPATLDPKLLQNLLREELGFEGLIISDASSMNGLTTHLPPERRAVEAIRAGNDVYLFPDTVEDYHYIVEAVHSGDLSEDRLREATRRVLEAKAWLNLDESFFGAEPTTEQQEAFALASIQQSEKGIVLVKQGDNFPVSLPENAKILTVTIGQLNEGFGDGELEVFDQALEERQYQVTHLINPDNNTLRSQAKEHDAVFINNITMPYSTPGTIRTVVGHFHNWAWRSMFMEHPQVYYTAFGNPYLSYEMPHIPNLLVTFGSSDDQQTAAVRAWLGEIPIQGSMPVKMPTVRIREYPFD